MHVPIGLESFRHVFIEKMPQLEPELMSMTGLNLYTTLCGMAKTANANLSTPLDEEMVNGMDMLWGVALRARNTDVSFNAIQYLNNYYINCTSTMYTYLYLKFCACRPLLPQHVNLVFVFPAIQRSSCDVLCVVF